MMISVNTGLVENGGYQTVEPVHSNAPTGGGFNLAAVLASQAPGHNAITAGVNKADSPFGGWTSLPGFAGSASDLAGAYNSNMASIKSDSRVTPITGWVSFWASMFGSKKSVQ